MIARRNINERGIFELPDQMRHLSDLGGCCKAQSVERLDPEVEAWGSSPVGELVVGSISSKWLCSSKKLTLKKDADSEGKK